MDSRFGQQIAAIAADDRYKTFCEVGTWNGKGSTRCFYEGLKDRPDTHLYSIEGVRKMYDQAEALWRGDPHVTVLYGTLHRDILSRNDIRSHHYYYKIAGHYTLHYESERTIVTTAPIVAPPPCDGILLDGGEFSSDGDWRALYHDKLKVVMLDDTQIIKTNRILNQLLQDPTWTCVCNQPFDRNGWAIFERKVS